MNKSITTLLIFHIFNLGYSQDKTEGLKFETKYYNAVDHYIAFPKKAKDSTFSFGFIYIDQMAGITFRYMGKFKTNDNNFILYEKNPEHLIMSYRLERNTSNVYVLNEKQIKSLELSKIPDWLKIHKGNENTTEYMKDIGYILNAVGGSQTALSYLEKAYTLEPHLEGLEFELAFAYNALKQHDKAIPVLENAIKNNSNNYLFYKELGYSYKFLGQIDNAEKTYKQGIKISTNDYMKAEMAFNMTHAFFDLRNKEKFEEWSKLTRKYSKPESQIAKYIDKFENKWDKN
ncbi:hypothetical protein OAX11_05305 [Flavobacteriaceae bacterium]|nr:hypothetical protein [Flavobacteriaceae bacterium]